jgi:amino acid permease
MKRPALILPALILGIALLVVAVVYFVDTASALPSFFPGHSAGSSHHHVKHGIAAFVLALGCFVFAWFQTGPASGGRPPAPGSPA